VWSSFQQIVFTHLKSFLGGAAQVFKHVSFHVAPEENDGGAGHGQFIGGSGPAQKHYNIIFIKAPYSAPSAAQLQQQAIAAGNFEKTLVYLLVKNPNNGPAGDAGPGASGYTPDKPEVYFIKYKASGAGGGGASSSGIGFSAGDGAESFDDGISSSVGGTDTFHGTPRGSASSAYGPPL
jgi:hypothetical protein